jgi:hypothetical protein
MTPTEGNIIISVGRKIAGFINLGREYTQVRMHQQVQRKSLPVY